LNGWLARGLKPKQLAVIEPQPGKTVKALARRGLKLNPKGKAAVVSAIVIAVKPQSAPERCHHWRRTSARQHWYCRSWPVHHRVS
jgi:pyrroline-5-carboxylate reductase